VAFDYETPFDREDPQAVVTFQRSFTHTDWVDGVSTIQAESNGAEDGFNLRFHRLEQDLEGLGKDTSVSLASLATARAALHDLLSEIKAELQRLDRPHGDGWETVSPPAGWSVLPTGADQIPFSPLGYFKDRSGMVQLRGTVTSSSAPNPDPGILLFTLRPDSRPETRVVLNAASGAGVTRVDIVPSGEVRVRGPFAGGTGSFVSLDGTLFRARGTG
jgi:hypothetical protein